MELTIFFVSSLISLTSALTSIIPHGTSQIYNFINEVHLIDLNKNTQTLSYQLKSKLKISNKWKLNETELLYFEFESPKVKTKSLENIFEDQTSKLYNQNNFEFYMFRTPEKIPHLYSKYEHDVSILNIKKAITSLFLFDYKENAETETDISGKCKIIYEKMSPFKYQKRKTECSNWSLKVRRKLDSPLDVILKSTENIIYEFTKDQILSNIQSNEKHIALLGIFDNIGHSINVITKLDHILSENINTIDELDIENISSTLKDFEEYNLEGDIESLPEYNEYNELEMMIKSKHKFLVNNEIGNLTAAKAFTELLPLVRMTQTKVIEKILKDKSNEDIIPQLLEIFGASQSFNAYIAVNSIYSLNNENTDEILIKYFLNLAIGVKPEKKIFDDLFNKLQVNNIQNLKLKDTIVQSLSVMGNKLSKILPKGFNDTSIRELSEYLKMKIIPCKDEKLTDIYIRGIQHLKDPSTISFLINIILNGEILCSISAMKALKTFPINYFNYKDKKIFSKIFYQIPTMFDTSVRALAFDILIEFKPSKNDITEYLIFLNSLDPKFELKTYVLQKISMIMKKCKKFESLIKQILKDNPKLNNYNVLAQKGLTTVIQRKFSSSPSFNGTLLSIQEVSQGVLKRGVVDLIIEGNGKKESLFTLGIFTNGLSVLVGKPDFYDDEEIIGIDDTPKAEMEIAIQGLTMQPIKFFNSQTELMGHIWHGTASEPTTAYQGTTLLYDHEEYIILHNGDIIKFEVSGGYSINLNGHIKSSLWNRNAHTEIEKNSAIAIKSKLLLVNIFIQLEENYEILEEPKINVIADLDFYSEVLLCLQVNRVSTEMRQNIERTIKIKKYTGIYIDRDVVSKSRRISGYTLALNQKNNFMCNAIFTQ